MDIREELEPKSSLSEGNLFVTNSAPSAITLEIIPDGDKEKITKAEIQSKATHKIPIIGLHSIELRTLIIEPTDEPGIKNPIEIN
jgi:hypothetical protein